MWTRPLTSHLDVARVSSFSVGGPGALDARRAAIPDVTARYLVL